MKINELSEIYSRARGLDAAGNIDLSTGFNEMPFVGLPQVVKDFFAPLEKGIVRAGQYILKPRGEWVEGIVYYQYDQVYYENISYYCIAKSTTAQPDTSDDWRRLSAKKTEPLSILGWGHTVVFHSGIDEKVRWDAGTLELADGTIFNLLAGETNDIQNDFPVYIYFSKNDSETQLQFSTTKQDAFGEGKILIAIGELDPRMAKSTVFDMHGSETKIAGSQILARSITSDEIFANTLTANEINTSTIHLSMLSGNLDQIDDGLVYSKVLSTSITAGQIKLDETIAGTYGKVLSSVLDNGRVKLDDAIDGTYAKVLSTSITAGKIKLSAAIGTLDDIADGTFGKVLSTVIDAGKIKLDETINGTYAKVLSTEINAGHIKITGSDGTTTVIDGGKFQTDSIKAAEIDVTDLFAQNITATGTITGVTLQTATTGQRVVIGNNQITFYDSSNTPVDLYGYDGDLRLNNSFTVNGTIWVDEGITTPDISIGLPIDAQSRPAIFTKSDTSEVLSLEKTSNADKMDFYVASGSVQAANGYKSSDGSSGVSVNRSWYDETNTTLHDVIVKNGIITSWTTS